MRIAVNCRSILKPNSTGIGRYTYHLLDSLGQIGGEHTYLLYTQKSLFDTKRRLPKFSYRNFKPVYDYFNAGPQLMVPSANVYHVPSLADVRPLPNAKLVVTIHDLIYKAFPQSHTPQTIDAAERQMASIVKYADGIICISQSTRNDVHRYFSIDPSKTRMVYNGVDHTRFYPLNDEQRAAAKTGLRALGIGRNYCLFVGTIEPRKNLTNLLKSFALIKSKKVYKGQLVVVGMKGWMMETLTSQIKELDLMEDIVFTGFISDTQLCHLYNLSDAFIFPSFYEGFGFPIIEAMACGTAVITSNSSSCSEVAGNAAVTMDPHNPQAMADAIMQVLCDAHTNQRLREQGLAHAAGFSFLKTAQQTQEVYDDISKSHC